eukprot:scaffold20459_cov62-Phaeocystis_antarctica.AAC.1
MDEIWLRGAGSTHNEPLTAPQRCQPTPVVVLVCLGAGGSLRRPPRSLAACAILVSQIWSMDEVRPWRHPQLVGSTGPHRTRAPPSADARPSRWRVRAIGVSLRCPCRMGWTNADGCGRLRTRREPVAQERTGWRPGHWDINKALERRHAAPAVVWVAGMCGHVRTAADHCGPLRTDGHTTRDGGKHGRHSSLEGVIKTAGQIQPRRRTPNSCGLTPLARRRAANAVEAAALSRALGLVSRISSIDEIWH